MKELQSIGQKLLQEKKVDFIVGYAKGTLPLCSTPIVITNDKECENLIFDFTCGHNLATYLVKHRKPITDNRKPIGVVAKGCDGRSIVQYIVEGQIKRENVVIIGVPCKGVVDLKKVREKVGEREILDYKLEGDKILLEGRDWHISLSTQKILDDGCLLCKYPNPPVYDVFIGEPRPAEAGFSLRYNKVSEINEFELVDKFEKMNSNERWEYFEREISKCIRCYACRNACPMCYCEECFVDQTNPQWFSKSTHISDTIIFHIIRLLHVAGRCVGCGACSRACPMGVNLASLGIRIEKEIKDRFGYTAGLSTDAVPPLAAYSEEDKQEFIM